MNFKEAIQAMKDGKKVRRKIWAKSDTQYIYIDKKGTIINDWGSEICLSLGLVDGTDWIIVKQKAVQ